LDEDVIYIITPEERSTFLALKDDKSRDSFVEQFWARRNPDPTSTGNSFKEEHYRRIAFANLHFSSSMPGWKTDQGRIYIMFGKPDKVEPHPGGTNGTYPYEDWYYHHIEGVGDDIQIEFVDQSGTGKYTVELTAKS
jgi:GWxTD domain-containing protein